VFGKYDVPQPAMLVSYIAITFATNDIPLLICTEKLTLCLIKLIKGIYQYLQLLKRMIGKLPPNLIIEHLL
jgi:hypothetical protein